MSDDLISRSKLLAKMFPYGMPDNGNYGINARAVRDAVVAAKTVEAEPVVHAHWEFVDFTSPNLQCSVCGGLAPMDCCGDYHSERTKRCPECGAHMDEKTE